MMQRSFLVLLLLFLSLPFNGQVLPSFGNTRTGTAGMQYLKIALDPRSAAMGGAFSCVSDDATATFWNPAAMIRSKNQQEFTAGNLNWFAGSNCQYLAGFGAYKSHTRFGFFASSLNYPKMKETTEFQPFGTGQTFMPVSQQVGFSYAKQLTDQFSFGINTKWAYEGIAGAAINNLMFDLGIRYDLDVKHLRFAVTVSNFGVNVKPGGRMELLRFNGLNEISEFQPVSVPGIFRMGIAMDPVDLKEHRITVCGQLNHYTDNNETVSLGAEYVYRKILYFRSGYEFGSDENGMPCLGTGLRMQRKFGCIGFDYSFGNKKTLGNVHRLGLVFGLVSKKKTQE
jgi:hypothetical protein